MSRYNGTRVFVNTNVDNIFNSVVEWEKGFTKVPDQQDPIYTKSVLHAISTIVYIGSC